MPQQHLNSTHSLGCPFPFPQHHEQVPHQIYPWVAPSGQPHSPL